MNYFITIAALERVRRSRVSAAERKAHADREEVLNEKVKVSVVHVWRRPENNEACSGCPLLRH